MLTRQDLERLLDTALGPDWKVYTLCMPGSDSVIGIQRDTTALGSIDNVFGFYPAPKAHSSQPPAINIVIVSSKAIFQSQQSSHLGHCIVFRPSISVNSTSNPSKHRQHPDRSDAQTRGQQPGHPW